MSPTKRPTFATVSSNGHHDDLDEVMTTSAVSTQDINQSVIDPNPYQARVDFADLDELTESIRQHGFQGRLRVRPHPGVPGRFQLVYGERRLRALRMLEVERVPCDVVVLTDMQMRVIGILENVQRKNLNPVEEAEAYRDLMQEEELSDRALASMLGVSRGYILNRLSVLDAPSDVQTLVAEMPRAMSAAPALARVADEGVRHELIAGIRDGSLKGVDVPRAAQLAQTRAEKPDEEQPPPARQATAAPNHSQPAIVAPNVPDVTSGSIRSNPAPALPTPNPYSQEVRLILRMITRWPEHALDETHVARMRAAISEVRNALDSVSSAE
jgi:ParB/RepB/Spo0J family partition protein